MDPSEYVTAYAAHLRRWLVYRPDSVGGDAPVGEITVAYHPMPEKPVKYAKRSEAGHVARPAGETKWVGPFRTFAEARDHLVAVDVAKNFDVIV